MITAHQLKSRRWEGVLFRRDGGISCNLYQRGLGLQLRCHWGTWYDLLLMLLPFTSFRKSWCRNQVVPTWLSILGHHKLLQVGHTCHSLQVRCNVGLNHDLHVLHRPLSVMSSRLFRLTLINLKVLSVVLRVRNYALDLAHASLMKLRGEWSRLLLLRGTPRRALPAFKDSTPSASWSPSTVVDSSKQKFFKELSLTILLHWLLQHRVITGIACCPP